jgi:hypothetical protein
MKRIPEEYIHFIWTKGLFDHIDLRGTEGEELEIIERGILNRESGPDIRDARLRIDGQVWVGNIEIHFKSSDWNLHHHDQDGAYDNVILHVVVHHDKAIKTSKGVIPTHLSLESRMDIDHLRQFESFTQAANWTACSNRLDEVERIHSISMKDRMLVHRLERKGRMLTEILNMNHGDWEKASFICLARGLGGKVNAEPFQILAQNIDLGLIAKHRDNLPMLEAYLLGMSGLLDSAEKDDYVDELIRDFEFLKHKYGLRPMRPEAWKHAPVRPASSPVVRIAQLARLNHQIESWHDLLLHTDSSGLLQRFDISVDGYWEKHHALGRLSKSSSVKRIGASMQHHLLINVVSVLRFTYGRRLRLARYRDSAISLLESIPPEKNSIIRKWGLHGMSAEHAGDSQALIELKNEYCTRKRCLHCSIGHRLLSP